MLLRHNVLCNQQARNIMLHEDEAGGAITGLQQKTHYSRPQWSQIFESISKAHPKYVTINSHM